MVNSSYECLWQDAVFVHVSIIFRLRSRPFGISLFISPLLSFHTSMLKLGITPVHALWSPHRASSVLCRNLGHFIMHQVKYLIIVIDWAIRYNINIGPMNIMAYVKERLMQSKSRYYVIVTIQNFNTIFNTVMHTKYPSLYNYVLLLGANWASESCKNWIPVAPWYHQYTPIFHSKEWYHILSTLNPACHRLVSLVFYKLFIFLDINFVLGSLGDPILVIISGKISMLGYTIALQLLFVHSFSTTIFDLLTTPS